MRSTGPILIRDLFEGFSDSIPPTFQNALKRETRVVLPPSPKLKLAFRSIKVRNFSIPEIHLRTGQCRAISSQASNRRRADSSFHLSSENFQKNQLGLDEGSTILMIYFQAGCKLFLIS